MLPFQMLRPQFCLWALVRHARANILTAERLSDINRIDLAQLLLQDAIKTVRGDGSREVAAFSDLDARYGKGLEVTRPNSITSRSLLSFYLTGLAASRSQGSGAASVRP